MVWPNWPKRNSSAHYSLVTKVVMQIDPVLARLNLRAESLVQKNLEIKTEH